MNLPKTITVEITQAHKDKARAYNDNHNCVLAIALREQFPDTHISVGGINCTINDYTYEIINYTEIYNLYKPYAKFPSQQVLCRK